MTKGIFTAAALLILSLPVLGAQGLNMSKVSSVIKEFSGQEGFERVEIGPVMLSLARKVAALEGDEDDKMAMETIRGVRRIIVVSGEDCVRPVRESFCDRIEKCLPKDCLLLESNEDGEKVQIFGSVHGDKISDLVVYSMEDCSLVIMRGKIDVSAIAAIAASED